MLKSKNNYYKIINITTGYNYKIISESPKLALVYAYYQVIYGNYDYSTYDLDRVLNLIIESTSGYSCSIIDKDVKLMTILK